MATKKETIQKIRALREKLDKENQVKKEDLKELIALTVESLSHLSKKK